MGISKMLVSTLVLSSVFLAGCNSTGSHQSSVKVFYVNAVVNSVERAPEICQSNHAARGNALAGAIIGGLIGNQIGSGNGQKVATALGVVAGANVATGDRRGRTRRTREGARAGR